MKNVLVVDDSAFMRLSLKNMLTRHGYTVVGEAENGRIALEKYKELSPDVVTLDITMNEMTGLEALDEIMKINANAKALMVSAMGQETIVRDAISLGAKGFLIKPFKEELVISAVSKLCE